MRLGVGLLALVATLSFPGCRARPEEAKVAAAWIDAYNRHDPDEVLSLLHSDTCYVEPRSPQPLCGGALRNWLAVEWKRWRDQVVTAKRVTVAPGRAVIEWHMQQTHPSGKAVPIDGATILDIDSRGIATMRAYYDTARYLAVLKR